MAELYKHTISKEKEPKKYIEEYWTARSDAFSRLRSQELHSIKAERWIDEITGHFPKKKELKILDVGCGSGFFTIMLSRLGYDAVGIDLTAAMIDSAYELAEREAAAAAFQVMDAEQLSFEDESFDVVTARNLTWTLPHPEQAYREWVRVLKPGGILLNYDAEYAKNHHKEGMDMGAHAEVGDILMDKCHRIYHMLDISLEKRPEWDKKILTSLGIKECITDHTVGDRIYKEYDSFYIPVPMFGIYAQKPAE